MMRVISPGREGDPADAVLARNDVMMMMMMIMFFIKMKMIMLELSFLEPVLIDND